MKCSKCHLTIDPEKRDFIVCCNEILCGRVCFDDHLEVVHGLQFEVIIAHKE